MRRLRTIYLGDSVGFLLGEPSRRTANQRAHGGDVLQRLDDRIRKGGRAGQERPQNGMAAEQKFVEVQPFPQLFRQKNRSDNKQNAEYARTGEKRTLAVQDVQKQQYCCCHEIQRKQEQKQILRKCFSCRRSCFRWPGREDRSQYTAGRPDP